MEVDEMVEPKPDVLYICDRKACGEFCPNPECVHTTNIEHALSFKKVAEPGSGRAFFVQN